MTNDAPERIWLQDDGDYSKARLAIGDLTWCEDQINDADTEYVRADLHTEAPVTVREAARVLRDAPELMEGWSEDGWADICALAENEGPSAPPRDDVE